MTNLECERIYVEQYAKEWAYNNGVNAGREVSAQVLQVCDNFLAGVGSTYWKLGENGGWVNVAIPQDIPSNKLFVGSLTLAIMPFAWTAGVGNFSVDLVTRAASVLYARVIAAPVTSLAGYSAGINIPFCTFNGLRDIGINADGAFAGSATIGVKFDGFYCTFK